MRSVILELRRLRLDMTTPANEQRWLWPEPARGKPWAWNGNGIARAERRSYQGLNEPLE
jgi:hypothetical protein